MITLDNKHCLYLLNIQYPFQLCMEISVCRWREKATFNLIRPSQKRRRWIWSPVSESSGPGSLCWQLHERSSDVTDTTSYWKVLLNWQRTRALTFERFWALRYAFLETSMQWFMYWIRYFFKEILNKRRRIMGHFNIGYRRLR